MRSLIYKRLFRTTKYSITGKGLLISKQSIFGYSSITIPYEKLDEEITLGKTYNKDLLNTSFVVLVFGIFRLFYSKTFADVWFLLLLTIFAACIGIVIFFPSKTIKEPALKMFNYFPKYMDNKLELFLQNLFETRDNFLHYREIDLRDGTDFEKQFSELVSLFNAGLINRQEFLQRKWLLKLTPLRDYSQFGVFYN